MESALEQLQKMTVIVADTGDAALVKKHRPQDCTTNPSLVLAALNSQDADSLVSEEVSVALGKGMTPDELCNTLTVAIGAQLAALIPGRVSTEVDARLSFDAEASYRRAHEIVSDYEQRGVGKHRILIKLAATWEGIQAAKQLEKEGINCNLTLLFSLDQAKACADAGVFLISPFVGRITDWYKKADGVADYQPEQDPGVRSVREIYDLYKAHGIETIVMGASFRHIGQIKALAGCDRLTVSPKLLEELALDRVHVLRALSPTVPSQSDWEILSEADFRWRKNQDAMTTEKLAEGIRNFDRDHATLLKIVAARLCE